MRFSRVLSLLPILVVIAACSDGGGSTTAETPVATIAVATIPPTVAPPSTLAPTTILETTTTIPEVVFPLTGLPVNGANAARPALIAKIDNAPGAFPQTGFNAADLVYEEIVNDGISRFAMVFQSTDSDPVGPCRSGRIQDVNLFGSLNGPLFVWSGGNVAVTNAIANSDLVNMGPNFAPVYFRSKVHSAPHNLYTKTTDIWALAPPESQPPAQQFIYRAADEAIEGAASTGVHLDMDHYSVDWAWNAGTALYERTQEGKVMMDAGSNSVVTTNNIVVLVMQYHNAVSPEAQSIGSGELFVFSGGNYTHGTWTRADRLLPFTLTDDSGAPIKLTPGRTFIELPRADKTVPNA